MNFEPQTTKTCNFEPQTFKLLNTNNTSNFQLPPSDFIIVGQGIAGTLLAYSLIKSGKNVLVIDNHHIGSSSKAAAGIINPITGRKYVKSWRIDDLLPFARQIYQELEALLGIEFYHERNVIRTMSNAKELNDWSLRTLEPGYAKYISDEVELGNYKDKTAPAFGYGEVLHGAQVDLPLLIESFKQYLAKENRILNEIFDFEQIIIKPDHVRYKELNVNKIIFCEGGKARENPYFNYLPFHGDKGEALIVRIPDANFEKMLKQQIFIVPLDTKHAGFDGRGMSNLYWIGATYERHYTDEQPSDKGFQYLHDHLKDLLKVPFEVVQHLAAVRPTVRDRRPFLGLHPQFPQLGIFNGLGTKGASLGPYWAKHFAAFLVNKKKLDEEVDIQRFEIKP